MNASTVTDEVGATDNRLTLSLAEHPEIKDWEDGGRYTVTLEVEQQSSGEFNVLEVESAGPAEGEPEAPTEEEEAVAEGEGVGAEPASRPGRNPAVERMMGRSA